MLRRALLPAAIGLGPSFLALTPSAQDAGWTQTELEHRSAEIQREIEALRAERFRQPVQVKLASQADFIRYAKQRQDEFQTPADRASDETIAKLLGLFPVDKDFQRTMLDLVESQVGGFYDPGTKTFYLMETMPKSLGGVILSHELGHALDDQLFDLDKTLRGELLDTDSEIAYAAVVEGSGTALMNVWTMQNLAQIDLSAAAAMDASQQKAMAEAPMVLWRPLVAVYLQGAAFLNGGSGLLSMKADKVPNERIAEAFRNRPRSSEQVLHPERYWKSDSIDEPSRVAFDVSKLPEGWQVEAQDVYGELMTAIVCTLPSERGGLDLSNPMEIASMRFTQPAAEGWDADRILLLGNGSARYLLWVSRWDSPRDAAEFYGAVAPQLGLLKAGAKAFAALNAAQEDGEVDGDSPRSHSQAELDYGEGEDVVVLRIASGVTRRDQRALNELSYSIERR